MNFYIKLFSVFWEGSPDNQHWCLWNSRPYPTVPQHKCSSSQKELFP